MHRFIGLLYCFFLVNLLCSCHQEPKLPQTNAAAPPLVVDLGELSQNIFINKPEELVDRRIFGAILDSSSLQEPSSVLAALKEYYGLAYKAQTKLKEKMYERIYGSTDSLYLLCAYHPSPLQQDSSCHYPLPTSYFVFNSKGQLILQRAAISAELITVMPDSLALLMTVEADCNGEGAHHLYQYNAGKWVDVLSNLEPEKRVVSYDANTQNESVLWRNQLQAKFEDLNQDGHQDLILEGQKLLLSDAKGKKYSAFYPYKKVKEIHHYIYKPSKESFMYTNITKQ